MVASRVSKIDSCSFAVQTSPDSRFKSVHKREFLLSSSRSCQQTTAQTATKVMKDCARGLFGCSTRCAATPRNNQSVARVFSELSACTLGSLFLGARIFFKQSVSMKIDSHHSPRTHAKELFCFHRPKNGTRCSEKWVGPTRRVISDGRIGRAV